MVSIKEERISEDLKKEWIKLTNGSNKFPDLYNVCWNIVKD